MAVNKLSLIVADYSIFTLYM